jgi:hypothetical protein
MTMRMMLRRLVVASTLLTLSVAAGEAQVNRRIGVVIARPDENQRGPYTQTLTFDKPLDAASVAVRIYLREDDPFSDKKDDDAQRARVSVIADGNQLTGKKNQYDQLVFVFGSAVQQLSFKVSVPDKRRSYVDWFIEGKDEYFDFWRGSVQAGLDALDALQRDMSARTCDLAWNKEIGTFPVIQSEYRDEPPEKKKRVVVGSWPSAAKLVEDCPRMVGKFSSDGPYYDGPNQVTFGFGSCSTDHFVWQFRWDGKRWKLYEIQKYFHVMCG